MLAVLKALVSARLPALLRSSPEPSMATRMVSPMPSTALLRNLSEARPSMAATVVVSVSMPILATMLLTARASEMDMMESTTSTESAVVTVDSTKCGDELAFRSECALQ